jgi:hypothetical protein
MNGHTQIIEMRRNRMKPEFVFINDYPCKTDWFYFADHATVSICPTEAIETLDLRFLQGIKVNVSALTEKRAKAIFEACKDAGALQVAAVHVQPEKHPLDQTGWCEVWHG